MCDIALTFSYPNRHKQCNRPIGEGFELITIIMPHDLEERIYTCSAVKSVPADIIVRGRLFERFRRVILAIDYNTALPLEVANPHPLGHVGCAEVETVHKPEGRSYA
jgi:hypothetical protein